MNSKLIIRPLIKEDYDTVALIYKEGMDTGIATFETQVPDWETWNAKFLRQCRFVLEVDEVIKGWIALTPFSERAVYGGVAEVSLYISALSRGKNYGSALLSKLIEQSDKDGFWTLQAKIFPENVRSIRLFRKHGFREVGVREKIAMRDGVWYDNILLEHRK